MVKLLSVTNASLMRMEVPSWVDEDKEAFAPDVQRLERKRGEWTLVTRRAIPGYVFVRCQMTIPLYYHLTRKPGVIKLLGMCSDRYTAIPEEQVTWIEALRIACGEQPDRASRAVEGTDGEIEIVDGPLLAIKDRVTKIDAHRRRATVAIELYDDPAHKGVRQITVTLADVRSRSIISCTMLGVEDTMLRFEPDPDNLGYNPGIDQSDTGRYWHTATGS